MQLISDQGTGIESLTLKAVLRHLIGLIVPKLGHVIATEAQVLWPGTVKL